ncbi:MAG: Tm-1-like ATP-binding domain-containing protein [Gammaproteobacteria bacterium]
MSDKPKVLLIVTLDTKEVEARYLRDCLEEAGVDVIHMDPSIRRNVGGAEISPDDIAAAAGTDMESVRALKHEGKCQAVMIEGAIKCAHQIHDEVGLGGILSIGGSMGTTLATTIMKTFPYGLPKVMISTMASGMTAPFVGTKDITMVNAVCDISGLNSITRDVYRNGALAMAGMAKGYKPGSENGKPLVLVSTLGTTEKCCARVRTRLEEKGYEVMVFHTTGAGGQTLEAIVQERPVAAVVDMSLVEIIDLLNGGLCSAGPDRGKAALRKGVPTIFAPGNVDFIIAGPIEQAREQFPGKRYHVHNAALTAVRTEEKELKAFAEHMAGIIAEARGPVSFYVPLKGFSNHDSPEGHLHDLSLPPVLAKHLRNNLPAGVDTHELDYHINDPEFADALVEQVLAYTQQTTN